jgi:hypothetical protein
VSLPDALHRGQADADRLGHGGGGPVRRLVRRLGCGQGHHLVDHLLTERLDARGPGLVPQKAVDALLDEALLPAPDAGLRLAGPAHDRDRADTVHRQQHDLGPPDMLLRAVAVARDYRQTAAVGGGDGEGDAGAHAPDSHASAPAGIPAGFNRHSSSTSAGRIAGSEARGGRRSTWCVVS